MGVMSLAMVEEILDESNKLGTVDHVYFEGGEAFMYYPILVESIKMAKEKGFKVGLLSNAYWATDPEDSKLWLEPIAKLGLMSLSLSADPFHYEDLESERTKNAADAAVELGIPVNIMSIDYGDMVKKDKVGEAEVGFGGVLFKGRAAVNLTEDAPKKPWEEFDECAPENLEDPGRVHIDPYGFVHVCQGLTMGNLLEKPLSEIVKNYDYKSHPIIGPLADGGPAELSRKYACKSKGEYADACHFCYELRAELRKNHPEALCPDQCYGIYD
jgi:MoaA/NifB/PqqE/SkfB family radical SAM enzyme